MTVTGLDFEISRAVQIAEAAAQADETTETTIKATSDMSEGVDVSAPSTRLDAGLRVALGETRPSEFMGERARLTMISSEI